MDTTQCFAQGKIDGLGVVRILRIAPNEVLTCSRKCASAEASKDGSIQCSIGWVKKMVNFRSLALIVDYEVILDKNADDDWDVRPFDFDVIDTEGHIHNGEFICDDMESPESLSGGVHTLYPGTRGKFRVYYNTFPKDGAVAAVVASRSHGYQVRIDLADIDTNEPDIPETPRKEKTTEIPVQGDMRERVDALETQVRELREELSSLRRAFYSQEEVRIPHRDSAKTDTMTDPGIGYHPLDNK